MSYFSTDTRRFLQKLMPANDEENHQRSGSVLMAFCAGNPPVIDYEFVKDGFMMTSAIETFPFTGPLWGESIRRRWILLTKVSDVEWYFLWFSPEQRLNKQSGRRWF